MASGGQPKKNTVIIKKIKKGDHGGHHGGAWKVAYADFVTAMMAFFLLLWLLSMVSDEKQARIAEYFKEYTVFAIFEKGGAALNPGAEKGLLEVKSDTTSKRATDPNTPLSMDKSAVDRQEEPKYTEGQSPEVPLSEGQPPEGKPGNDEEGTLGAGGWAGPDPAEKLRAELKQAIEAKLGDMQDQVLVDTFEGGVRIQVVDKEGRLMFALGGTNLTESALKALKVIADRLKGLDNKIAVEGHTDALHFASDNYTNWELSTARASAARLALNRFGLPPERLTRVAGYADTEPLIKDNPNDPRNRRISILIYNKPKEAARGVGTPPAPSGHGTGNEATPGAKTREPVAPKPGKISGALEEIMVDKPVR